MKAYKSGVLNRGVPKVPTEVQLQADLIRVQGLLDSEKQRTSDKEKDLLQLRHDLEMQSSNYESEKGAIMKDLDGAVKDLQEVSRLHEAEKNSHIKTNVLLEEMKSQLSRAGLEGEVAAASLSSAKALANEKEREIKELREELNRVTYELGAKASELSFKSGELVEAGQGAVDAPLHDALRKELDDALRALAAEKSAHDLLSQESVLVQNDMRTKLNASNDAMMKIESSHSGSEHCRTCSRPWQPNPNPNPNPNPDPDPYP